LTVFMLLFTVHIRLAFDWMKNLGVLLSVRF
jgi:hypothetical protein